uniref:Uncharacterized protein n=1 Tax=Anguilla anguilla TaxID=7936 RepID=A0A0E9WWE6_ANGAN
MFKSLCGQSEHISALLILTYLIRIAGPQIKMYQRAASNVKLIQPPVCGLLNCDCLKTYVYSYYN